MSEFKNLSCTIGLVLLLCINPCIANINDDLSKIENDIFGFDYTNDKQLKRVERLEKTIYGTNKSGDINSRVKKLSGDISADVIGLEITPTKDTFLAQDDEIEDSSLSFPIVEEIERKIFNTTYPKRDFHTRIVTIEKKVFGKIYDIDDYPTRLDRIKEKVFPERIVHKKADYNDEYSFQNSFDNLGYSKNRNRIKMPFGQRNYSRPYQNYGDFKNYDDKLTVSDDLNDNLTQMEYDMFGTEFSSDDTQTRIKRLNSVNKAKKSSHKYDTQKFSQHMSTAMEIGAMILMILAMVL